MYENVCTNVRATHPGEHKTTDNKRIHNEHNVDHLLTFILYKLPILDFRTYTKL